MNVIYTIDNIKIIEFIFKYNHYNLLYKSNKTFTNISSIVQLNHMNRIQTI